MKRHLWSLCLIGLFQAASHAATSSDHPVLSRELSALTVVGKIDVVHWTWRLDGFTLQAVIPKPKGKDALPRVEAWLLRADGSRVLPRTELPPKDCRQSPRCLGAEAQFSFPLSVADEAVAAALSVDDVVLTEPLPVFRVR